MKRHGFLLLILVFAGCHKRTPVTALPPPVPVAAPTPTPLPSTNLPSPPSFPQPSPPSTPVLNPLDQADNAFNVGNYTDAARRYERYLDAEPSGDRRDQALFRLALSLALPQNGNTDWTRITTLLKQLVDQYPQSSFRAPATVILSLAQDSLKRDQRIKQLSSELDKLKQIDAERRKRP